MTSALPEPSRRPATGPGRPQCCPPATFPAKKISSSEPTYAAYKRPAPLLSAPQPNRKLPVAPNCTATPPFAPPPSTPPPAALAAEAPPQAIPDQGEHGSRKPSPPSSFPPCPRPPPTPGCRRPPPAEAAPASLPCSGSGEEEGHFCPKPLAFLFILSPSLTLITLSPSYSKIAPRLIINYRLNTVKP
jgi:hypothetical protein